MQGRPSAILGLAKELFLPEWQGILVGIFTLP
jgi:hypothetical protein